MISTPISTLAENPEEAQKKREADAAFQRAGEEANFWARAESLKTSLWGIWQRPPEEASIVAGEVAQVEAWESQEPEIDFSAFDIPTTGNGNDTLTWSAANDTLAWETQIVDELEKWKNTESIDSKISEDPASPLIERLVADGVISSEIQQQLQEKLAAGMEFSQVIESSDIEPNAKQMIKDRWEDMNNPENQEAFETDFGSTFPDIKDEKWDFKSPRMEEAFTMVGSAYLVGESHNPVEQKASLDMAFKTAGNKAIKGKQFERSISFQENMKVLQDGNANPNERMEALTTILKLVDTDQAKKWLKTSENHAEWDTLEDTQLTDMIEEAGVWKEYSAAKEARQVAQTSWDTKKIEAAQEQVTQIVEKAAQLTGTPLGNMVNTALEIWEVDMGQETSPKTA